MKKLILAASICAMAPMASADTLLGIYAGAGQWQSDYSGDIGEGGNNVTLDELGFTDSDNNFFYVALEHPVPLLPNARIQHMDLSSQQSGTISRDFTLDGETFTASEQVDSDLDLTHTDFVLYYEFLDNWVTLDLGLNVRKFDGYVTAESENRSQSVTIDEAIPMLYGKVQFDLPLTGWAVGVEGSGISYDDNTLTDLSAKVSYMFESVVDLGLELGYRQMNLELNEDVTADVELKGPYAAVVFHF